MTLVKQELLTGKQSRKKTHFWVIIDTIRRGSEVHKCGLLAVIALAVTVLS